MSQMSAKVRVRVWFGQHRIAEYVGEADRAESYANGMERRFACCRITRETQPECPDHRGVVSGR